MFEMQRTSDVTLNAVSVNFQIITKHTARVWLFIKPLHVVNIELLVSGHSCWFCSFFGQKCFITEYILTSLLICQLFVFRFPSKNNSGQTTTVLLFEIVVKNGH